MNIKLALVLVISPVGILTSCGSSPQKKSAADGDGELPPYQLEYSDVMEFTRGVAGSYRIAGSFRNEQPARVTLDGVPLGAIFENETLSWMPSCDLKPENGQFLHGYMLHRLRISLASTVSDSLIQKPAIIIVHKDGEDSTCQ